MDIRQAFKMAFKSLWSSKLRSILTMLGIIIGVAAVIAIMSIGQGMMNMVSDSFSSLGANIIQVNIYGRGSTRSVTIDDMYDFVNDHSDVLCDLSPLIYMEGQVKYGTETTDYTSIQGVSEAYDKLELLDVEKGRFMQYIDIERRQSVCVIGSYVDKYLFNGDSLGKYLSINGQKFLVVGVLAEQDDSTERSADDYVYIPYATAAQMNQDAYYSAYAVNSTTSANNAQAVQLISDMLTEVYGSDDYFYVQSLSEMLGEINKIQSTMVTVIAAIAGISLLVGGIGIMNIMLVSVTERTREIGIRKSLGARRRDIRTQFIIEAACTSAIGGVIGIVLGLGLGFVGGSLLQFHITPSIPTILVAFGVSVGIGMLFGYLPANKAAKLNPIDALRYD